MKRAIFLLATLSLSHCALADICFTTFEEDSTNADVIFVGKVIDVNYGAFWFGGGETSIYTFEIIESFKGISEYRTVTSLLSPVYGCCSPHFKLGSTFLVFAFSFGEDSLAYWTNDCTLTDLLSESREYYERLGEPLKPNPKSSDKDRFIERRNWQVEQEQIKNDSLNKLSRNLQLSLANKQRTNTYMSIALTIFGLLTLIFVIQRIRSKKST